MRKLIRRVININIPVLNKKKIKARRTNRYFFWDLSAIVIIAILSLLLLHKARYYPEIGYDESAAILGINLLNGHFGNHSDPMGPGFTRYYVMDCYPPVYYLVSAAVFFVTGFGIIQARAVSVLFIAATALLCYVAGRRYAGTAAGFAALAAYIYIPLQVYTIAARPDVAVPFFVLASVLVLWEAQNRWPRICLFAAGILYGLAILSHFVALMAIPFMVLLVGWLIIKKFGRIQLLSVYLAGFCIPILLYLLLIYPYLSATLNHLVSYKNVGSSLDLGITNQWPIRPILQHISVLNNYFPLILYGLLPLGSVLVVAGLISSQVRQRITSAGFLLSIAFVALFILVGTYPNILTFGYYSPLYLVFGAVTVGITFAAIFPKQRWAHLTSTIVALTGACLMLSLLQSKVQDNIAQTRNIPLKAAEEWTWKLAEHMIYPTLATPHWVFSAAGERVMTNTFIVINGNEISFDPSFHQQVPESLPLSAYKTMIVDQYNELYSIKYLLNYHLLIHQTENTINPQENLILRNLFRQKYPEFLHEKHISKDKILSLYRKHLLGFTELEINSFETVGIMWDGFRLSANFSISRKTASYAVKNKFPRVARSSPTGVEELHYKESCSISIPISQTVSPVKGIDWLWSYRLQMEFPPELQNNLMLARVVLQPEADSKTVPFSFLVHYPSSALEQNGLMQMEQGKSPVLSPTAAIGLAGLRLPTGERGRDLLIQPDSSQSGGHLVLYSFAPTNLQRVDLLLPLRQGQRCSPTLKAALQKMSKPVAVETAPIPILLKGKSEFLVGEPVLIHLDEASPIELVVWLDGKIVDRKNFERTTEASIKFSKPGKYGIEVWTINPKDGAKSVMPFYITVE